MPLLDLSWTLLGASLLLSGGLGVLLVQSRSRCQATERQLAASRAQLEVQRDAAQEQALQLMALNARLDAEQARFAQLERQLAEERAERSQAQQRQQALQLQAGESRALAEAAAGRAQQLEAQLAEVKRALGERQAQFEALGERFSALDREHATLRSTLEQRELHFAEQQQLLKDSREQLKLEFEQLAGRIFEAKGQAFSQHSQQSLAALLKPFREQIDGFRAKVEDIHHKDTQQQAALAQQLLQLNELNQQITREAQELATALKGQKKMQGNWGELILENVLERSGLVQGRDFLREASFSTEQGRRRPDVLVHLPQGKHLVIDAKVSLNAYTRFVNAEDEAVRRAALNEHVAAIAARIRELADRHYFDLPGLNAPEMVFMFVPIESAFVEALRADETLFQKAIERNVLVATPTTLLTSLNIVRQLWRFEAQNKHTAELADRAGKVYDKLRSFLGSMEQIESGLDKARDAYCKARDQLVGGRGNLVKQVKEFQELGVSVKAELGERWVERAELELALIEGAPVES